MGRFLESVKNIIFESIGDPPFPLKDSCRYYFERKGKMFRPMVVLLISSVCNHYVSNNEYRCKKDVGKETESLENILKKQLIVASCCEMIHTASLIHDDIIDESLIRRGQPSVNAIWGNQISLLSGNYIIGKSSSTLSKINDNYVVEILTKVISDLVSGEFKQLINSQEENKFERFSKYINKTYQKTSSLIANGCLSASHLSGISERLQTTCYDFGKHIGIAFQLVDDALDFVSDVNTLGKPSCVDMSLGLATAPILFATEKFPILNEIIQRQFKNKGDVEQALKMLKESDGVEKTFKLAHDHVIQANRHLESFHSLDNPFVQSLVDLGNFVLNRNK